MKPIDFTRDLLPLKDKIFRLALRVCLDRTEAEDITQDVLLRAWERRKELSEVDSVEAWVLTVTRRLAIDRIRKSENRNVPLDEQAEMQLDNRRTAQEQMEHEERMQQVHRLFNLLPEKQRTVLQLRDIEGKNVCEVAAIMGLTEENIKVITHRARQNLKQLFNHERNGL